MFDFDFVIDKMELPTIINKDLSSYFKVNPYPFQARIVEYVKQLQENKGGFILLQLPTGGGKTRGIITPSLRLNTNLISVYPTNALIADQKRQIIKDIEICKSAHKITHEVHAVDRHYLNEVMEKNGFQRKGRALYEVLINPDLLGKQKKIVLTNPDILNLLKHGGYALSNQSLYEIFSEYPIICFDELHMYNIKQLTSIIHLANWFLSEDENFVFILSTATMDDNVKSLLCSEPIVENFDTQKPSEYFVGNRQILSKINLKLIPCKDWSGAEWIKDNLSKINEFEDSCVIILDNSYSMDYVGIAGRRFDRAKEKAAEIIDSLKSDDSASLIL
ncbi:MAG: type I-D CRISPR-associated helicase Cas3', partial [Methanosarcinales archaeon]